jgi:poly(beta-D-mannuronate) lyase
MRPSSFFALVLALAAAPAMGALVPPPGFSAPAQQDAGRKEAAQCASAPRPYTGKLAFPSKYEGSDKARDQLNPKAEKAYEAQTADIRAMEKEFSALVDRYLDTGHAGTAACALRWLEAWAQAGALTASTEDHTGKSMRKWALGSIASAYLRLKFSASRPLADSPEAARRAEEWFARLGEMVIEDWKDAPLAKFNNHEYWAAWAVMATAVALDRRDWFDWALAQYRRAVAQIDAEGYLPNELARETRALHYHNYSLGPLAMIAAFAKANGVDVRDSAAPMQRLAHRVLSGVDDPRTFEEKTGEAQETEDIRDRSKFAWLEAYCWTFGCDARLQRRVAALRPIKTYRLGGNVTDLFSRTKG